MASPDPLPLRCLAVRHSDRRRWYAVCVDLDLVAVGDTIALARASLDDAIGGYVDVVVDTLDIRSVDRLLSRRGPVCDVAMWHALRIFAPRRTWIAAPVTR